MKFRVLGGDDAPDWVLSGVYTLSKLGPDDIRLLTFEIVRQMLGEAFDYEKALGAISDPSVDAKSCIAALNCLIAGAAKFNVDEDTVSRETQQLGLPPDLSDALRIVYKDNKSKLMAKLSEQSLRLPPVSIAGWQIHQPSNDVVLRLTQSCYDNQDTKNAYVRVKNSQFQGLLTELKTAKSLMDNRHWTLK